MQHRRLLSISFDRTMFDKGSAVSLRMVEKSAEWDEMHIIVFAERSYKEIYLGNNIWVYPTRSRSRWLYPFGAIRLGRFIAKRRGITNITCQDPFLTAMAGTYLKKRFNLPLEIQVHTDIGSRYFQIGLKNRVSKMLALSYLPQADTIRVVSQRIQTYLIESIGISDAKITVQPILVDTERIKHTPIDPAADLHVLYPQFKKIVLMASRLEKEKDIKLALHAWSARVTTVSKAGLVIVGSGREGVRLKKIVTQLNIADSVVFEAWADARILVSYYKTADLFLNTSLYEGYGMTLVEACAAGCPVISTDVGIAVESGALIAEHDPIDIGNKIVSVVQS